MNWGKGLTIALIAFAGMMAYFVVLASQNPEPLITERYYEQELVYQERINATSRALSLGEAVFMDAARDRITLRFPEVVAHRALSGDLSLLRANDPAADRSIVLSHITDGHCEEPVQLQPGPYIAQLEWRVDSTTYYTEEKIVVP